MAHKTPDYLRPYEQARKVHGADFRTTLWASRDSQRLRFEVLAETVRLAGRRVLDAGCGMGDLLEFLEQAGQAPARYVGVDALAEVVEAARGRRFATPADFLLGDIVSDPALLAAGSAEVIVISGTLNTLDERLFYRTLDAAYASAGECLAFNFLSTCHARGRRAADPVARRHDPVKVLAHGLRHTRDVIVRHDYFGGHDCTMAWLKVGRAGRGR